MELRELSRAIVEKMPNKAIEIFACLDLLIEAIEDSYNELHDKHFSPAFICRDFSKLNELTKIAEGLDKYVKMITEMKNELEIDRKSVV